MDNIRVCYIVHVCMCMYCQSVMVYFEVHAVMFISCNSHVHRMRKLSMMLLREEMCLP